MEIVKKWLLYESFPSKIKIQRGNTGGNIPQWLAYLLSNPAAPGSIPSIPNKFSEENIEDAAEVNQRHCFEES